MSRASVLILTSAAATCLKLPVVMVAAEMAKPAGSRHTEAVVLDTRTVERVPATALLLVVARLLLVPVGSYGRCVTLVVMIVRQL